MKNHPRSIILAAAIVLACVPRASASYPVTIVGNPADRVNWVTQLARAQSQLQQLQAQISIMGNPGAAAGMVTNINASEQQIRASVNFGAGNLLSASSSNSAPVISVDLSNVNVSRVLSQSGLGVEINTGGVKTARNEGQYATLAARQIILSQAETELAKSRQTRADLQAKLVAAWQRLASSSNESQQRVIQADIQSLQTTHDMLLANEQSIIQGRDTALALIDNEAKLRAVAAGEAAVAKANQRDAAAEQLRQASLRGALDSHLAAKAAPVQTVNWSQTVRPVWSTTSP
jgi:hypothetical protein